MFLTLGDFRGIGWAFFESSVTFDDIDVAQVVAGTLVLSARCAESAPDCSVGITTLLAGACDCVAKGIAKRLSWRCGGTPCAPVEG
mmetsp:Transcript_55623/g.90095  ORF Transcript_55623/g.90095 Transcript_55623/m.90095 type:complete len:86 (-) Transcript_55623:3608-3865(-)